MGLLCLVNMIRGIFLWNYAVDSAHQGKGHGTKALEELLQFLKNNYSITEVSTTYLWGNDRAKQMYEKVGFFETGVVEEDDVHEVNMVINL